MSEPNDELIASNLTLAFYSAQEPRKAYVGPERRRRDALEEGQRDLRDDTLTIAEVHGIYERFLRLVKKERG